MQQINSVLYAICNDSNISQLYKNCSMRFFSVRSEEAYVKRTKRNYEIIHFPNVVHGMLLIQII
jgi:hypothetical protein